ncbi:MAG TPA: helix-turn-helix transcriptional regulator [Ktedonobacterales bacterium]|nr:helix-turn-helix transcriptional regulator [Ktedonobacterales bacterium]
MPRNDHLTQERLNRGWSQADVAAKIGSDPKTVGRWERGLTSPSPYLCQQLCQLYGKTPQELGLRAGDQPGASASPAVATLLAAPDEMTSPSTQPPARGLKRWPLRKRRPILYSVLAACVVLVAVGAWAGTRLAVGTPTQTQISSNPYTGTGTLAMSDPLTSNQGTWPTDEDDQGTCSFATGGYEIRGVQEGFMQPCMVTSVSFRNLVYEVQLQIRAGDCGGLAFRSNFPLMYYFIICSDGHYRFVRYDKNNLDLRRIIVVGISSKIHQGHNNQANTIAVMANGDAFTLYINHVSVGHFSDGAYAQGQIGLLVNTCRVTYPVNPPNDLCTAPTDVLFQHLRVWKL